MTIARVNVLDLEMVEALEQAGFRHEENSFGDRIGARRIGASVYEAVAGRPIWPYHYHHGVEEWQYVIAGAPCCASPRESAPWPRRPRLLPVRAHTLTGPGRFAILATGQLGGPWMSVYPDSDVNLCYPDGGRWVMRNGHGAEDVVAIPSAAPASIAAR